MKLKIKTKAYARKTNDPPGALTAVLGNWAFNNRSREAKLLRGVIRGDVRELPNAMPE